VTRRGDRTGGEEALGTEPIGLYLLGKGKKRNGSKGSASTTHKVKGENVGAGGIPNFLTRRGGKVQKKTDEP